jgi:hypothetical protein
MQYIHIIVTSYLISLQIFCYLISAIMLIMITFFGDDRKQTLKENKILPAIEYY